MKAILFVSDNSSQILTPIISDIEATNLSGDLKSTFKVLVCCKSAFLRDRRFSVKPEVVLIHVESESDDEDVKCVQLVQEIEPLVTILLLIEHISLTRICHLLEIGASDFVTPPFESLNICPRIWRLARHNKPERRILNSVKEKVGLAQLIGQSRAFADEVEKIPRFARSDANMLLMGDTGTGKEMFARAVHYLSPRQHKAFVPVDCGALPAELVENELFGHEAGAYTSALTAKPGLMREADGGTLFLDELHSLPLHSQSKLLRFLQEKEYRPIGSGKILKADVRIIAATNVDIESFVRYGLLRKDLFYRINILSLTIPRLRERNIDIPLLAHHFFEKHKSGSSIEIDRISPEAMQKMQAYDWPGNVRELEHVMEKAIALATHDTITAEDIHITTRQCCGSFKERKAQIVAQFEKQYVEEALVGHAGNISEAARATHKDRRSFFRLIKKYHIDVPSLIER